MPEIDCNAASLGAVLSSYSGAAQASLTGERYGLAKLARKIVVEIPFQKNILEILLHKILKFSTRLNFKILTKPDSKLR